MSSDDRIGGDGDIVEESHDWVKLKMIMLDGAEKLRHLVLKKWGYEIVSKNTRERQWKPGSMLTYYELRFRFRFPCPKCGDPAYEIFNEVKYGKRDSLMFSWRSACEHVYGTSDYLEFPIEFPIGTLPHNGQVVGWVGPYRRSRPIGAGKGALWKRYWKVSPHRYLQARFGTMLQAQTASVEECELLAVIQKGET